MATVIVQQPLYDTLPVGQEVIFTVKNFNIVTTQTNVKFVAHVFIDKVPIVYSATNFIGTFKTTPNAAGHGMFDLSSIIESYVKADNLANIGSSYKGSLVSDINPTPVHLVDKFSRNINIIRYLAVSFQVEYLDTTVIPPVIVRDSSVAISSEMNIYNGYVKPTDILDTSLGNFGYFDKKFFISPVVSISDKPGRWLTNAPNKRFAQYTDYGVASVFSFPNDGVFIDRIQLRYTEYGGTTITETIDNTFNNGGQGPYISDSDWNILHYGCYPANIYSSSSVFKALVDSKTLASYTVKGQTSLGVDVTDTLTIEILCPNQKGYKPIRLTWLNQWGTWDYYTFNMKSIKSISTQGSTYQQLGGTWNSNIYQPNSFKGGKKSFRVNATEKVIMNTDFVNETESEWFEELINSTEIYILEGFQTDNALSSLNNYVTPVRLTTSNYTRKTLANDKLMQYTFEVEKSKTLRTQAV